MEEVRFTGKTAHISLDRYQSLLEAERKLIDIKEQENDMINIPIKQYWELNQAKEELHNLKFPDPVNGKTVYVSLDRYRSLLKMERRLLIDIKRRENETVNIPIRQFWDLMRAKEELHYLKSPDIPATFDPGSKVGVTEQEFKSVVAGNKTIEEILAEREKTHGDFGTHAAITDAIKFDMQQSSNWSTLGSMKREALDMIAHKIGRILAGNPNVKDHWDDIAGYAKLVSRELK